MTASAQGMSAFQRCLRRGETLWDTCEAQMIDDNQGPKLPGSSSQFSLAVTLYRILEYGHASRMILSTVMTEAHTFKVKAGLTGGKLVVQRDAKGDVTRFKVPKAFAQSATQAYEQRMPLPEQQTSVTYLEYAETGPLADMLRTMSTVGPYTFVCTSCGQMCGMYTQPNDTPYPRCLGYCRVVTEAMLPSN